MENISISYPENGKNEKNSIVFDIKGDEMKVLIKV